MAESRKVEFPGATGAMLAARLDLPAEPRAFALFAHCFTCGKDIFAASRIAGGLRGSVTSLAVCNASRRLGPLIMRWRASFRRSCHP